MPDLKLIALDSEDLSVISAHVQDAVLRVADMTYLPREKRFVAVANRFDWEKTLGPSTTGAVRALNDQGPERRRTGLRIERVLSAKVAGLDLHDQRGALVLLAITFTPSVVPEAVDGDVTLTFSGGPAIRLKVECLEIELKDLGAVWSAQSTPTHPADDQ